MLRSPVNCHFDLGVDFSFDVDYVKISRAETKRVRA